MYFKNNTLFKLAHILNVQNVTDVIWRMSFDIKTLWNIFYVDIKLLWLDEIE